MASPAPRERLALYAAVAIAVLALVVAAYAATRPAQVQPQPVKLPPPANATVMLAGAVSVDAPGAYRVPLGWIYISNAPAVVQLTANYSYAWFLLDGVNHGNPAVAVLAPGNHTVDAIIAAYANGTKIKIDYRIVG